MEEVGLYSEEYVSRRVKKIRMTGKEEWTTEIGEENQPVRATDDFLIKENSNNVINNIYFSNSLFL